MSKIDELKEIKSDIKEVFKALLYLMLGILTGISSIAYSVLIHKIPAYMILVGGIGLLVIFMIGVYEIKLWNKMQELNKEMRDAE
jgi:hypothetical protein